MSVSSIPLVSLFCGAGGLDCGFRNQKFQTLIALDHLPAAVQSYNLNVRPKVARLADLAALTPAEIDQLMIEVSPGIAPMGVIGGPPCQGFSRGNASADPNDPRNLLPFKYADILKYFNAKYTLQFFVFENVMGLKNPRHRNRYQAILEAFDEAGFRLFQATLNASDFGVAQNRPRLFIVGLNRNIYPDAEFEFPVENSRKLSVREVIHGLPKPSYFTRGMTSADVPFHPNHWTMAPKSPKFKTSHLSDGRSFRRLEWDSVSPTVAYGNREIHVHPDGDRRLSVHEAMLLQGFPNSYQLGGTLSQQITQVSNAVPPPVAKALAKSLAKIVANGFASKFRGENKSLSRP